MCFWIESYQYYPFLFMEASVKGDSECLFHTLCHHFCTHNLPRGSCVSDCPFKVGEELLSFMSSASSFLFCFDWA